MADAMPLLAWTGAAPVGMTAQDSLDCRVGVDANGRIHAVWRERTNGSNFQIWYAENTGGPFSNPPQQISQGGADQAHSPAVALNGTDVHVAYIYDPTGDNIEIFYRKAVGGAWGPFANASNTGIKSLRPSIDVRGGVGPVIAWDEAVQADDRYDTFFTDWNGSGFNPAINISNTPGGSAYGSVNVNVVITPDGDVTAIWVDRQNSANEYHPNVRRRVGGVWGPRQEISTKQLGPSTPGLAAGHDNQVHTVYESDGTIWYQKWNGATWTAPQALPGGLNQPLRCKMAVDDQGICHVVCDDSHFGVGEIRYSTNASGNWSAWSNISNTPNTNSITPDIDYAAGVVAVVWQENSDGQGGTGVFNVWHNKLLITPPGPTGTIAGNVRDQFNNPVPGASVAVGARDTVTAGNGSYTLSGIPVGTHTVTAGKLHYGTAIIPEVVVLANATSPLDITLTLTPPQSVSSFTASAGNTSVSLNWINPGSANFQSTVVRAKTDDYPSGPTDGLLVVSQVAPPGSAASFTHTGLLNGSTYFYAAFAYDGGYGYSGPAHAQATPAMPLDRDRDGDVDQSDFGWFQQCLSGPSVAQLDPACADARLDGDSDVDGADLDIFIGCMTVPNGYALPECGE